MSTFQPIHARMWNSVGRASDLGRAGDFIVRDVAGESIIVLRDRNGTLRAFFNTCRHCDSSIRRDSDSLPEVALGNFQR